MRLAPFLGAVGIVVLCGAPAASAAFPGSNGRIAFHYTNSLGTINAVGGDRKPLISQSGVIFASVAWSADGSRIAFVRGTGGAFDVWSMSAEGTGLSQLTATASEESAPSWSPDGQRIAFDSDRDDANGEIYTMRHDGTDVQRLTAVLSTDTSPAWSPDGRLIAFSSTRGGNADIWVMGPDGGAPARLTNDAAEEADPDWSPDGSRIVFERDTGIVTMAANGAAQTPVAANANNPVWSPDGTKIVFERDLQLHTINPDGSGDTPLTSAGAQNFNALNPNWQPIPHPPGGGGPPADPGGGGAPVDGDGDGVFPPLDCNDGNAAIRPGARDKPGNKVDENCDGRDARRRVLSRDIDGVTATYPSGYLEFRTLAVRPVRKGDRIRLSCKGAGCEFKRKTMRVKKNARKRSLLPLVKGMELRKGAVVQLRVTRAGAIGRVKTWTVRAPKAPKIADRCLSPGAKKPSRCPSR